MSNRKQRRQTAGNTQVATARDGFANLAARMGVGAQNVLSEGTYIFDLLTRNRMKLEAMYRGSWIVGAAVDSVAEDMTRSGITIQADTDPKQIQEMQTMLTRLGIWHSLLDAIKWGRLYGGAIAAIVVDGQDPSTPLNVSTIGQNQFRGLRVYDRWSLQPSLQDVIEDGMDAGLPKFYDVVSDINSGKVSGLKWHHSRVIRFIGVQLPLWQAITEQMWGESIIERMNDRLISFDTATAGAANLINKAHLRTVQIDKLREVLAAGGKAEENLLQMFHHMRMLQVNEGLTLLDKEDQFQAHSYTFSGLSDMVLQFGQQISGASGIPLVRLFGQSPSGLNSTGESDLRMYYDNILAQQESRLREGVMRVLRVLHMSKFGQPAPENFDFDFVPLWQTPQKEKVEIAKGVVEAVTKAHSEGVIDTPTAMKELKQSAEYTGVFSNITEELITEAENEPPPMPVETAPPTGEEDPEGGDPALVKKPSVIDRLTVWIKGGVKDGSDDQPRDPDGKFASGGGAGSDKPDAKGLVPVESVFKNKMGDPPLDRPAVKGFKPYATILSPKDIIPTQEHIHKASAEKATSLKDKDGKLPPVIKQGDKYFLLDGHHRVANAIASGKQFIHVKVDFEVKP